MHVETDPDKQLTASGKPRSVFVDASHAKSADDSSSVSSGSARTMLSHRKGQVSDKGET